MNRTSRYRSRSGASRVVGLSISYQRDNLLARGLGLEHLRELLLRLARPLLRASVSLAFGGHWKMAQDNFTFDLLRLISAEQQDNSLGGPDTNLPIGRLYNHSPWPGYLDVTPRIEAQWINCCRIVRVTQQHAGFGPADVVPDDDAKAGSDRAILNAAVTLSAMRRLAMETMTIAMPGLPSPEPVPAIGARVLLGGKVDGYSGFLPGLFDEALATLERGVPLFVLGGFGGAAETLAHALLDPAGTRRDELTEAWHRARNANVAKLAALASQHALPASARTTAQALDALYQRIEAARPALASVLDTGLSEPETRELLATQDMRRAVQLVHRGIGNRLGLTTLPA